MQANIGSSVVLELKVMVSHLKYPEKPGCASALVRASLVVWSSSHPMLLSVAKGVLIR